MLQIDFFKLNPRLARIKHLGLFSFWLGIISLCVLLSGLVQNFVSSTVVSFLILTPFGFLYLSALVNLLFLKIRRLNDFNFSGWWVLLFIIPLIGEIFFFSIFFIPGTMGANRFGEEPKEATHMDYLLISFFPISLLILILLSPFLIK